MRMTIGLALFATLALGCSDSHSRDDAGSTFDGGPAFDGSVLSDAGRVDTGVVGCALPTPERHRAAGDVCPMDRGTSTIEGPPEDWWGCRNHDECTEGTNGRCTGSSFHGYNCTYDQCFGDAECGSGPCICRGMTGGIASAGANRCVTGGCQVDSDCGAGGFCSPTLGECGDYSGTVGYYCHTCEDQCTDDDDCTAPGAYCAYDVVVGRWHCQDTHCAG